MAHQPDRGTQSLGEARQAVDHILKAALCVAPDSYVRDAFSACVDEMRAAGESDIDIVSAIAGHIRDGILYGNWIWYA